MHVPPHDNSNLPASQAGSEPPSIEFASEPDEHELTESWSTAALAGIVASVVFHLWLMAVLASMNWDEQRPLQYPALEARLTNFEPVEEMDPPVSFELANPNDREMEVRKVVNARSAGFAVATQPQVASAPPPRLEMPRLIPTGPAYDIPEGLELDNRVVIKGNTGESSIQIESALDRVTWEIADHLRERKVLVVWLIDASASLKEQRLAIAKRLRRVYGELGALEQTGQITPRIQQGLLSGVVTFGEKTTFITPEPTADFDTVLNAVTDVKPDQSGKENVFGAMDKVVHQWGKYRTTNSRSIMTIIVTDETGDDFAMLEPAILSCKKYGVKSYVIGPAAVFGRRKGFVAYRAPEDGKTYQLPVDLGPETFAMEAVSLRFWFGGPQYEYLSSGLGPYGLSRLVTETGGIYFMTNMTTTRGLEPLGTYASENMKNFAPDYRFGTPDAYMLDVAKHPLRKAIVTAAQLSQKYKATETPLLELRVRPENYLRQLDDAQKRAAETTYMLDMILQAFPGSMEKDYQKERSQRWRVNYDLAYGRLLALKTRAFEYNSACAQLKQLGAGDIATKSNHWVFQPSRELSGGATSKKMATEADKLLKRVLEQAPGTPWAILASRELSNPLGFRVVQRFEPPPKPPEARPQPPAKKGIQLANETKPKKAAPPPPPPPKPVLPNL